MKNKGMLSYSSLQDAVKSGEIETVVVSFTDHYGRQMGKRFDAEFFVEQVSKVGTHACDYLLTTDMEMEPVEGYDFANWELGYGDFHLLPDMDTLRRASWLEKTAWVHCEILDSETHIPLPISPRSILYKQIQTGLERGWMLLGASELEYFLFETDYRSAFEHTYTNLKPAGWYLEDYHLLQGSRVEGFTAAARKHLKYSGVPVEGSKGEWGLGQHEMNIQYAELGVMADRHVLVKQCMKELADKMGLSVSFMAKYDQDQAGSSCHIHLSLWKNKKNAFVGDTSFGPIKASKEFGWFLGGWMKYVPDLMVCYAPTVNSYKRYQSASWAPTRIAWSLDNRTAGFRVVGQGSSLRIECRIPGADCNPYLAYAAALASGLAGIAEKIEPPQCFEGDVYEAQNLKRVPVDLAEATLLFSESTFAKEVFGEEVVAHYSHFFRKEWEAYQSAVTDWERKRYFERI